MAKAWAAQIESFDKSLREALSPRNIALKMIGGSSPAPYAKTPEPAKNIVHQLIAAAEEVIYLIEKEMEDAGLPPCN